MDRFDDAPQIAFHESYSSALDSNVRARAHGDANIGSRQRRSVIDAIASHADDVASSAKFLDFPIFVLRRNFGVDLIDISLFGNGLGGGLVITGKHDNY